MTLPKLLVYGGTENGMSVVSYPSHFVPRSFRTQVVSYPGRFVPRSFRTHVVSYPSRFVPPVQQRVPTGL